MILKSCSILSSRPTRVFSPSYYKIMNFSSSQKTLLVVLAIIWLMYFCTRSSSTAPVKNFGAVNGTAAPATVVVNQPSSELEQAAAEAEETLGGSSAGSTAGSPVTVASVVEEDNYLPPNDFAPPVSSDKFGGRNRSHGAPRKVSYASGQRGGGGSALDSAFGPIITGDHKTNDQFQPNDGGSSDFAAFSSNGQTKCGSNGDCPVEDLFNNENYLPREVNDDWFDTQPEPVSVKNHHLINVTRPIGVSTTAGSLRNASHDLRGNEPCPKFVVSPFLQSSIEPDFNIKPMM